MWDSIEDVKVGTVIRIKPRHRRQTASFADCFLDKKINIAKIFRVESDRTYPIRLRVRIDETSNQEVDIDFHELCEHFELATADKIKKLGGDLYQ